LTSSADLRNWQVETVVLRHVDSRGHAWQYVDWLFDGDDMIAASRTAWDGAHRAHDANYLTFHRIADFRHRTLADSPDWLGMGEKVTHEAQDFTVEGSGYSVEKFDNDAQAFGNRRYVWKEIPPQFCGWSFTRTDGGVGTWISVRATHDTVLYAATAGSQAGADMAGWQPVEDASFHYTDSNATRMNLYRRNAVAGQEIAVLQTNWSGTIVLIPPKAP